MMKKQQIPTRKTHFKARGAILIVLAILCIGVVSAGELTTFDNIKQYDESTKTVTIVNTFGLGRDISTIQLTTPVDNIVGAGYGKVAELRLTLYDDTYANAFDKMEFYDLKSDWEVINRQFDYKYKTTELIDVNDYGTICSLSLNGTEECYSEITGTHKEEKEVWLDLDTTTLLKGTYTIGIFTDVQIGDYVEWIPTFFGKKIDEWASWTASLNVDLEGYYYFDENTGLTSNDEVGTNDFDLSNANLWKAGASNYAIGVDTVSYLADTTNDLTGTSYDWTLSFWTYRTTDDESYQVMVHNMGTDTLAGMNTCSFAMGTYSTGFTNVFFGSNTGSTDKIEDAVYNTWEHTVLRHTDGGVLEYWRNGVNTINSTNLRSNCALSTPSNPLGFGRGAEGGYSDAKGYYIDEMAIFDRALTYTEIVYLNNSGTPVPYAILVTAPIVTLNTPINTSNFTTNSINFGGVVTDNINLVNVSLIINDVYNETNTSGINNSNYTFSKTFADGDYTWTYEACDNASQCLNATVRSFSIDTSVNITLTKPDDNSESTISLISFNGTVTTPMTNLINVSLIINDVYNETNTSGIEGNYTFIQTLPQQILNWTFEACNPSGCENATARNLTIHTTPSTISIPIPNGTIESIVIGDNQTINWSVTEPGVNLTEHIVECLFTYNGNTFNVTDECITTNTSSFLYVDGVNFLNFSVTEEFGITTETNVTWGYNFVESNITFDTNISETSSQFFELNLSTTFTVLSISAQLNYNGTKHVSSAECNGNCLVSNTIDIPLVKTGESDTMSFFWEVSIFNGTDSININTSTNSQNVSRIHLERCDATYTNQSLNFTAYDEQNLTQVNPYKFDATFLQWLGSGSVKRENSFSDASTENVTLCIDPADETYFIDAQIDYDEVGAGTLYTIRNYFFQNHTINNVIQNISLYLLKSSSSTSFILKVQDDSLLPVSNALIETHRFYPGTGEFRIVQIARTDEAGKSVGFFVTETVDYKFIITQNSSSLLETEVQKVIPETSPFTLTFTIGEPLGEPWADQEDIDDLTSTLEWDSSTGIVTYIYIDSSGDFDLGRLLVIRQDLTNSSNDTTICDKNSALNSATLTCSVGTTEGFYLTSSFNTRNSVETLDIQFSFTVETLSEEVGLLGLFFGWFLILIASFMFKFNEIAGIWAITVTVFLINLTGLINFGGVFVTAVIAVAIILTWIMEK